MDQPDHMIDMFISLYYLSIFLYAKKCMKSKVREIKKKWLRKVYQLTHFYILIIWEFIGLMWKIPFRNFHRIFLPFKTPWVKKSKDKFVKQLLHPTKIVKIRAFFGFLKKSKTYKSLLIILIIFFDYTNIRKITVYWNLKKVSI